MVKPLNVIVGLQMADMFAPLLGTWLIVELILVLIMMEIVVKQVG